MRFQDHGRSFSSVALLAVWQEPGSVSLVAQSASTAGMAAAWRPRSQLHPAERPAPPGRLARNRAARHLEPRARRWPLGDSRRRGAAVHDVSDRQRADTKRPVGRRGNRRLPRRRDRQDDLGVQVPVEARRLQPRARATLDADRRRRSAVHLRHEQAAARLRQAHGQGRLVARSGEGVRRADAADSSGREGRIRMQPDRLEGHHHLLRRRSRAGGDGVPAARRQRRVEERTLPHLRRATDADHVRRPAAARHLRGRRHQRPRSGYGRASLVARPRSGQRLQFQPAAVGHRQRPLLLVGLQGRKPRRSIEEGRRRTPKPRSSGSTAARSSRS